MALRAPLTWILAGLLAAAVYYFTGSVVLAVVASYLPSYFDGTEYTAEGRYWHWFATHPFFQRAFAWFPATVRFSGGEAPALRRYIVASHPHGAMSIHHAMSVTTGPPQPNLAAVSPMTLRRDIGASVVFKIPLYRDFLLWLGMVDASAPTCHKVLKSGKGLGVLPGGEAEQMLCRPGEHMIWIKNRKGFCRLALQYGLPILPGYAFGETDLYSVSEFLFPLRYWIMKRFRVALPLTGGPKWWLPFWPHRKPITLCFGRPLEVGEPIAQPSQAQIDELHARYIAEIQAVFDANKASCGYPEATLKIM